MADDKISNFVELITAALNDLVPIVDVSAGAAGSKKITLTNLRAALAVDLAAGVGLDGGGDTTANRTFDLDISGLSTITSVADANTLLINVGGVMNQITFGNFKSTAPDSLLHFQEFAGKGSTDTRIIRWANLLIDVDTDGSWTDNHTSGYNGNTEGLEITIDKAGIYGMSFTNAGQAGGGFSGLTLNGTSLSVNIDATTQSEVLCQMDLNPAQPENCCVVRNLAVNDVIRTHGQATSPTNVNLCSFIMKAITHDV